VLPVCGKTHDKAVNAPINLYSVELGHLKRGTVEQALVDSRSHPAKKQEAQSQKVEQSAHFSRSSRAGYISLVTKTCSIQAFNSVPLTYRYILIEPLLSKTQNKIAHDICLFMKQTYSQYFTRI
jgi:hypothetical protein